MTAALAALGMFGLAPAAATGQAIEMQELRELDAWGVGRNARQGPLPLPRSLWRNSTPEQLIAAFDATPAAYGSPAAARIVRQVVVAAGETPPGEATAAATRRFEAIARIGAAEDLLAIIAGSSVVRRDPGIAAAAVAAELGLGRFDEACRRAAAIEGDPAPIILRLRALCLSANGAPEAAELARDALRSQDAAEYGWLASAIAASRAPAPARLPGARYDTVLNTTASLRARLPAPPTAPAAGTPALSLMLLSASPDASAVVRARAALGAMRLGAGDPVALRNALKAAAGVEGAPALALATVRVEAAGTAAEKAREAAAALRAARSHADFVATAQLFAAELAAAPAEPLPDAGGLVVARAMLALGETERARQWRRTVELGPLETGRAAPLDLGLVLGRNDNLAAKLAADQRIETAARGTTGLVVRDLRVMRAMGLDIGMEAELLLTRATAAPGRKPDPAKLAAISAAAARGAVAETALLAASLAQGGAETLDTDALTQILRALREVGLDPAARMLAVEAVIGGQAR